MEIQNIIKFEINNNNKKNNKQIENLKKFLNLKKEKYNIEEVIINLYIE